MQSQGVGTSLKHFALNNQEYERLRVDVDIDERTLREIYLACFESVVKEANPATVMCAYNRVLGDYCSENKYLLTDILRDEWKYEGFVVSDWGAVNYREKGIAAGLDLEMPSNFGINEGEVVRAVKEGRLDEKYLDKSVERLLKVISETYSNRKEGETYSKDAHHELCRKVSSESMVLLENRDEILPLSTSERILVVGELAKKIRYQGNGSSHVNYTMLDDVIDKMSNYTDVNYLPGYDLDIDDIKKELIDEVTNVANKYDKVVIFVGLSERYESESYDRSHIKMPDNHVALIQDVAKIHKNVVVVLSNGSPIEMIWKDEVKGIIESYLGGQAFGGAIADVLFGKVNPSGKLAESFPVRIEDTPCFHNFPGEPGRVKYGEGIFVGYRHYDKAKTKLLYPFGYGLSYTQFEYSNIQIDKSEITDQETVTVSIDIKNVGKVFGREAVQLYISDIESEVKKPFKELKGFEKVALEPNETKTISFALNKRSFAHYDVNIKDWLVESGDFEILIGASSQDIRLKETVKVISTIYTEKLFSRSSLIKELEVHPIGKDVLKDIIDEYLCVIGISEDEVDDAMNQTLAGVGGETGQEVLNSIPKHDPIRRFVVSSGGKYSFARLESHLERLNKIIVN